MKAKKDWKIIKDEMGRIGTNLQKLPAEPFFHDLRRTAVSDMARSATSERVARAISGDTTRIAIVRYNIVNDNR